MTKLTDEVLGLIAKAGEAEKREVFSHLRKVISLHPLEQEWNVPAEAVLAAIARSPDLTQRGIRGILAEAVFEQTVIPSLVAKGWKQLAISGNPAYDFRIAKDRKERRIQVKLQRKQSGEPMDFPKSRRANLSGAPDKLFCVEVQKTRSGKANGKATRPYHFGDFDILAVNLHPSTGDWNRFVFTVGKWLLPRSSDRDLIEIFQPVPATTDSYWTDNPETCLKWSLENKSRTLYKR